MRNKITDEVRLYHIIECADEIEKAIMNENFKSFINNHVLRIAVVKWIEIIGEAVANISKELKLKYADVNWREIQGMRNVVVHKYIGIKYELIWEAATLHVPEVKKQIEIIYNEIK